MTLSIVAGLQTCLVRPSYHRPLGNSLYSRFPPMAATFVFILRKVKASENGRSSRRNKSGPLSCQMWIRLTTPPPDESSGRWGSFCGEPSGTMLDSPPDKRLGHVSSRTRLAIKNDKRTFPIYRSREGSRERYPSPSPPPLELLPPVIQGRPCTS